MSGYVALEMLKDGAPIYVRRADIVSVGRYTRKKLTGVMLLLANGERVAVRGTPEQILDAIIKEAG